MLSGIFLCRFVSFPIFLYLNLTKKQTLNRKRRLKQTVHRQIEGATQRELTKQRLQKNQKLKENKIGEEEVYSVSSSAVDSTAASAFAASLVTSSTGRPFAARLATVPNFVAGVYAPPVKV
jgi:predicted PP-loop superfamily ATPase